MLAAAADLAELRLQVPLFIKEGEVIRVDTR